jgi:glycosyltransferase involved in cell wall biosynthesis
VKISIITVVYNNEKKIRETIQSVLSQKNIDLEYIIIDGASKDNTMNIINEYIDKISLVISEKDKGIYDAMNKGIELATGDIIGILNSDDIFYDEYILSNLHLEFQKNSCIDIIYGNILYVDYNNTDKVIRNWISKEYSDTFFKNANVPPHPSTFVKKVVYQKSGNYNQKYHNASDYDFLFRILEIHKFNSKYMNAYFVKMRIGGASNKSIKNRILQNLAIINIWKDHNISMPFYFFPIKIINKLKQYFL